jgi:hypothetical protein
MDGVWLPAGERHAAARGLPDSRHTPRARDCQGGGLFPLGPPPFAGGEQNAQAESGRNGPNKIKQLDRD